MPESMFFPDEPRQAEEVPVTQELNPGTESTQTTPNAESPDTLPEEARVAAILSYIPFLCFIPLLNMRDNKEAFFHARQGLILFLFELLAALFLIGALSNLVFKLVLILAFACSVVGIWYVLQGKKIRLPLIGDLADKIKL